MSKVVVEAETLVQVLSSIESRANWLANNIEINDNDTRTKNDLFTIAYGAWHAKKTIENADPYVERLVPKLQLSSDEERQRREIYSRMYVVAQSCDKEVRHARMDVCAADLLRLYGEGSFADIFEDTGK